MERRLLVLSLLLMGAMACDRPQVTAAPELPSAPLPATTAASNLPSSASAPSQSATPPAASAAASASAAPPQKNPAPASASASPARQLDASKEPAPPAAGDVCQGAAREGCVPKNDPFGFVARE